MARIDTSKALEKILCNPSIWRHRAQQDTQSRSKGIATGFASLDQVLPEAGWPISLTELLVNEMGAGELSLLTPALRAICNEGRGIALIGPPYLPQARAWQAAGIPLERLLVIDTVGIDLLWSAEQTLRSGECGAVLVWGEAAGRALNHRALQRLQLAASAGNTACFLYRSLSAETNPSPAPLRLRLTPHEGGLRLHFLKNRGAPAKATGVETFPAHWQTAQPQRIATAAPAADVVQVLLRQPQPVAVKSARATAVTAVFPEMTPANAPLPFPLSLPL